jgi:hypothetical protein
MNLLKYGLMVTAASAMILSFARPSGQKEGWVALFNGKDLSGWDTYIGPPLDDAGKKLSDEPVGWNKDPKQVFTVIPQDGENIIRISGENWGAISTTKEYGDYHLQLLFKWGSLKWGQKKGRKRDSGLLYHSVGPNGADYGAWMRSQEFQIEEGNTGDYWGVAGGTQDIPVIKKSDSEYVYSPGGELLTFSAGEKRGRHGIKRGDAEKPSGEWNTLDLYCHGDTSVHVVNGKAMMVLYHSGQLDDGRVTPLVKGKIQIQSEGAEVFYKQIRIRPLEAIPNKFIGGIRKFTVDDYPVTNNMFGVDNKADAREIKSGPVRSLDKVWFANDVLKQTLVFELYTDDFRNASFQFLNNDIPKELIKRMEIVTEGSELAGYRQKEKYFKGFMRYSKNIDRSYFTTNKGFRLGDKKEKAIAQYGRPDKITRTEGGIETLDWDFTGENVYDGKMNLKGKPLAIDNFGHQVAMFFRNDTLIAIILHNDIP